MWLFTTFGYFSVVQKPNTDFLTIRARVAGDLDNLREKHLPELSATITGGGTDYPFRATVSHAAFAAALVKIAADIHYSDFKTKVAKQQGEQRAHAYHKVWGVLYNLPPGTPKKAGGGSAMELYNVNITPFVAFHYSVEAKQQIEAAGTIPLTFGFRYEHQPDGLRLQFKLHTKKVKVPITLDGVPSKVTVDLSTFPVQVRLTCETKTVTGVNIYLDADLKPNLIMSQITVVV